MALKPYPANIRTQPAVDTLEQIAKIHKEGVMPAIEALEKGKLKGRLRTGFRSVPADALDVITTGNNPDVQGDFLNDSTYFYLLVSDSGTLKWHRESLDIGW